MNELKIFTNDEFGNVRVINIDGEPWMVGKDIAEALGYSNPRKALQDHVDEEDKGVTKCDTPGGAQNITIINESGMYSLVIGSKLPSAKVFKRWITSEVLPSIRKTGGYVSDDDLFIKTYLPFADETTQNLFRTQLYITKKQNEMIANITKERDILVEEELKWEDDKIINALVRRYAGSACDGNFGRAWKEFKKELLYKHGINIDSRITRYKESTGKKTNPRTLSMLNDTEMGNA